MLADECTTIQTAVAHCRILSRTPNGLPSSLADYEDVRIALENCERIFDVIAEKLEPILALVDGGAAAEKLGTMPIRARISAVWNRDEIDFLRQRLQGQATALDFLVGVLQYNMSSQGSDKLDAALEILRSAEWKQHLRRSTRYADTIVSEFDRASSLVCRSSTQSGGTNESILGDEAFSFDDETVNAKAYRSAMARHSRNIAAATAAAAEATGSPSSSPPKKAVTSTLAERVSSPSEGNSRPALLSAAPSKTVQLTSVVGRRQLSFYPYESPGNKHHRILRVVEESVDEMGQSNAIPLELLLRPRSRCSRPSLCTVRQSPTPDELRHPGRLLRR